MNSVKNNSHGYRGGDKRITISFIAGILSALLLLSSCSSGIADTPEQLATTEKRIVLNEKQESLAQTLMQNKSVWSNYKYQGYIDMTVRSLVLYEYNGSLYLQGVYGGRWNNHFISYDLVCYEISDSKVTGCYPYDAIGYGTKVGNVNFTDFKTDDTYEKLKELVSTY